MQTRNRTLPLSKFKPSQSKQKAPLAQTTVDFHSLRVQKQRSLPFTKHTLEIALQPATCRRKIQHDRRNRATAQHKVTAKQTQQDSMSSRQGQPNNGSTSWSTAGVLKGLLLPEQHVHTRPHQASNVCPQLAVEPEAVTHQPTGQQPGVTGCCSCLQQRLSGCLLLGRPMAAHVTPAQ
jgi:hypothetical protein